jgi:peptidoglycan/LPS O-acetylase OafA/YrhL
LLKKTDAADSLGSLDDRRQRNRSIDICRGVAILGMMFHHYFFGIVVSGFDFQTAGLWGNVLAVLKKPAGDPRPSATAEPA